MFTLTLRRLTLVLVSAVVCLRAEEALPRSVPLMQELIGEYASSENNLRDFYENVRHSKPADEAMKKFIADWEAKLAALNFEALTTESRIDYLLLRDLLRHRSAVLAREQSRLDTIATLVPFRGAVQDLENARLRTQPMKPEEAAAALNAIPGEIKKLRDRIEKGRKEKPKDGEKDGPLVVDRLLATRAADSIGGTLQTLDAWYKSYDGYLPEFSFWTKKPREDAGKALEEYAKYLREEIAGVKGKEEDPIIGEPLGESAIQEELAHERIAYSAKELIGIAERQLEMCEKQMKVASNEMGFGDDWKKALEHIKEEHEPAGHQDQYIAQQAREAIDFVKSHDLVTVPRFCEDYWRINMIGTDAQKTLPYAAYNNLSLMSAFARQDMSNDLKLQSMRGNNRSFLRIVTAHELIPGHHLQLYSADRYRPYRKLFYTPFYVEGWALYWELRLWDLNFGRTPDERVGMLFWHMHRAARIIVTLKYHLGEMPTEKMIDFLVERIGHERAGATSEVRRYVVYPPLYQVGYLTGGLQLMALRKELVESGKMTDRQFNDNILKSGPIPIEYVRAGLLNVPLTLESTATWHFEDGVK